MVFSLLLGGKLLKVLRVVTEEDASPALDCLFVPHLGLHDSVLPVLYRVPTLQQSSFFERVRMLS